jgi:hypothetical protein
MRKIVKTVRMACLGSENRAPDISGVSRPTVTEISQVWYHWRRVSGRARKIYFPIHKFWAVNVIFSFIHQWLYSLLLDLGRFISFLIHIQTVGLLGRGISPSQGCYLHTGQHKHKINAHTNIHAFSGIRTHDPSLQAGEDCSCLRPRGHYDRKYHI